jgi:hypothetical protein
MQTKEQYNLILPWKDFQNGGPNVFQQQIIEQVI